MPPVPAQRDRPGHRRRTATYGQVIEAHDPTPDGPTADEAEAEAADLKDGIASPAGLVTNSLGLDALPAEVATFVVSAVPRADGAGVTLRHVDRPGSEKG